MSADAKKSSKSIEFTTSENFVRLYANSAQVEVTLWDFRVVFGDTRKIDDGKLLVENSAVITMSPQHAKVFAALLSKNVLDYEKQVGEIKIPEERS
jgi:hypothetical protein